MRLATLLEGAGCIFSIFSSANLNQFFYGVSRLKLVFCLKNEYISDSTIDDSYCFFLFFRDVCLQKFENFGAFLSLFEIQ